MGKCNGAVVGVDLEVLYSHFGAKGDPQARIVAARQSHRHGALQYTKSDIHAKQAFEFTFTVSFIRADDRGDSQLHLPPRPSLPMWLPRDLFYPFAIGCSSRCKDVPLLPVLLWVVSTGI